MDQVLYVSLQDDERILRYDFDEASARLSAPRAVAVPGGPVPLVLHPSGELVYAGLRNRAGLAWLLRDRVTGDLKLGGEVPLDADPCYVNTDRAGRFLFSTYYRAGMIAVHALRPDGSIAPFPVERRATAANAHSMQAAPGNHFAFVPHTGPNLILQFRFDPETGCLSPNDPPGATPPAGVGPRHFWFHPGGRLVVFANELGNSASSYRLDPAVGTLTHLDTASTLPSGFSGKSTCAEIRMSLDGRFVYVSNRGHDSIATFALDEATGKLRLLATTPSEKVPRAFGLGCEGRVLVAAGQDTGTLAVYSLGRDGIPVRTATVEAGRKPLWVLAAPIGRRDV
jgi:6-phosphogluconolactonase